MSNLWFMVVGSTSETSRKNCRLAFAGKIHVFGLLVTTVALVTFRQRTGVERFEEAWTIMGAASGGQESDTLVPAGLIRNGNEADVETEEETETGAESVVAPVLSVA